MEPTNDGTAATTSAEATGSETTPAQAPTEGEDPIALARKRQAGAEAARQKAQEEAAELRKRLETYEAANRTAAEKDLADNAKLQERLAAAERRAEEADAKAQARILDALYPKARAKFPEITDEVRLAELQVLYSDPVTEAKTPPTPQNPNESNRVASGDATASKPNDKSFDDMVAEMKAGPKPNWF